jgi:riboflavin kinase/FMN adenylyltransferase
MLVRFGVEEIGPEWPGCVVSIGTFDGVHLGHQEVIRRAVDEGRKKELPSVVVTFDRHPMAILAPDKCPPAVGTLDIDLEQFERHRVSLAVVLKFDEKLASTTATDFQETILKSALKATSVVVGADFAFGKGREGTPKWLATRMPTQIVPPFEIDGHRVSSSEIRSTIANGEVEKARKLLGRPWVQEGVVVAGQKLGRTLGFPTLNLATVGTQVRPADGVYAGVAVTKYGTFKAAIGIGMRPTVGVGPRTIEAFLLDYPGESLYGAPVRLGYLRKLREDKKFDSIDELKVQMERDVAEAALAE